MLKQAICVKCMIKNIHDHNNFFVCLIFSLYFSLYAHSDPCITVTDLSPETIQKLHIFSDLYKGQFTINVEPFSYTNSLYNIVTYPFLKLQNSFNTSFIISSFFSFVMSFGWISYITCIYITYRVYLLIKHATSWSSWCSDQDLIKNDREYLLHLLREKTLYRTNKKNKREFFLKELKNEELFLKRYFSLTHFLKKYSLLRFFPYVDKITQNQALLAHQKIILAQDLMNIL